MIGHDVADPEKEIVRKPDAHGAVLGAGVQGDDAPVLRPAHLRPGLLGAVSTGAQIINSTKGKKERVASCSRCTPTRRTLSTRRPPATSTR
jgi:hypothetical protein